MICRLRIVTAAGVRVLDAIGDPAALADAAYDADALGVTVMVLS
jgi:hypothetical protein